MDKKISILIVEDDVDINNLLSKILSGKNYNTYSAYSGSEAKLCLSMNKYDLVLLDLMLPGLTGETLITEIRSKSIMPIIVISAKSDLNDKVNLLTLGADDYITKPFEVSEVIARVEAQLRRYKKFSISSETTSIIKFKNLTLNKDSLSASIKDESLSLTSIEFKILELLMSNPKKVFTKDAIYNDIWDNAYYGEDNTVNVHISNIRSKINKIDNTSEYIKTVWSVGFIMAT